MRTFGDLLKDINTPVYIMEWANDKAGMRQKMKHYVNNQRKELKKIKQKK